MYRLTLPTLLLVLPLSCTLHGGELDDAMKKLKSLEPSKATDFSPQRVKAIGEVSNKIARWIFAEVWRAQARWDGMTKRDGTMKSPATVVADVQAIAQASADVDAMLRRTLKWRKQMGATRAKTESDQSQVRSFLRIASHQISLSGKIRYALRDLVDNGSVALDVHLDEFNRMLAVLRDRKIDIGAHVLSYAIFDPEPNQGAVPYPAKTKKLVFELLREARSPLLLPDLADYIREGKDPRLAWEAAKILFEIGVPQDARPEAKDDIPKPEITAADLLKALKRIPADKLPSAERAAFQARLKQLAQQAQSGVSGDKIRVAGMDLQVGDWLLMRNPSPYNRFTNLSPGIFTHVGVVTEEKGKDGKRRFVIVEMPERGRQVPATNVDAYLKRTLHYLFLRHEDKAIAGQLGVIAASCQGRPTHFDLNFQTELVRKQAKTKIADMDVIHTYCAGFLLMCAQRTPRPEGEFFPVLEHSAGGHCAANLKKLGLAISDDFVSPTGPLFSARFSIVGHRNPMYDPGREIREAVFDHFADSMVTEKVELDPGLYQRFRQSVIKVAQGNPLLTKLIAQANNVSERLDLDAAARAATAIEILDEVADGQMAKFLQARQAITIGDITQLPKLGWTAKQIERVKALRKQHSKLFQRLQQGNLSPGDLRQELVDYYCLQGRQQIDQRFFRAKQK